MISCDGWVFYAISVGVRAESSRSESWLLSRSVS